MSDYDWRNDLFYVAGIPVDGTETLPMGYHEVNWIIRDMAGRIVDDSIEADGVWADAPATESVRVVDSNLREGNTIFAFRMDSTLYDLLFEWYDGYWNMRDNISNFVTNGDCIFFTSADDYDSLGEDLLGGAEGDSTLSEFDRFVAERA